MDSVAGLLRKEGVNVHDIPCQSDQLSCICGKWQCRWGSIGDHLCEGMSHSRGGFLQCLYMNGVPRGPSYLCALLLCSFLGTTCADGLVQREVFLLKEVLNGVAVQEAFNYLVLKCSFECKEQSISCKSWPTPGS